MGIGSAVLAYCLYATVYGAVMRSVRGYPYKPLLGFIKYPEILLKMVKPFLLRSGEKLAYDMNILYAITEVVIVALLLIAVRLIYKKPVGFRFKGFVTGLIYGAPVLGLSVYHGINNYRTPVKSLSEVSTTLLHVLLREFSVAIFYAALMITVYIVIKEFGGESRRNKCSAVVLASLPLSLMMLTNVQEVTARRLAVSVICTFCLCFAIITVYAVSKNFIVSFILYGIEIISSEIFGLFAKTEVTYPYYLQGKADYDTGTIIAYLLVYGIVFVTSLILLLYGLKKQEESEESGKERLVEAG